MAALTAAVKVPAIDGRQGYIQTHDVKASETVFKGGLVTIDKTVGAVKPCPHGAYCAGICLETGNNETGAIGAVQAKVLWDACVVLAKSGATRAKINDLLYATTDNPADVVFTASSAYDKIGWVVAVPASGYVVVQLAHPGATVTSSA